MPGERGVPAVGVTAPTALHGTVHRQCLWREGVRQLHDVQKM